MQSRDFDTLSIFGGWNVQSGVFCLQNRWTVLWTILLTVHSIHRIFTVYQDIAILPTKSPDHTPDCTLDHILSTKSLDCTPDRTPDLNLQSKSLTGMTLFLHMHGLILESDPIFLKAPRNGCPVSGQHLLTLKIEIWGKNFLRV